jgi:hypothetical protein
MFTIYVLTKCDATTSDFHYFWPKTLKFGKGTHGLYPKNHTKLVITLCGKHSVLFLLKQLVHSPVSYCDITHFPGKPNDTICLCLGFE